MHAEVQRQGQVLKAALSRLGNLGLSVAFHHWEGVVRTRKFRQARAVHLLLVAETRLKQRRWGVAMRHWSGWAASKRAERAQVPELPAYGSHFDEPQDLWGQLMQQRQMQSRMRAEAVASPYAQMFAAQRSRVM